MHNTTKIFIDLKNYLRNNYGNSIKDVILFGSRARGDAENDSDFDVLIILDKDYLWKYENKIF